MTDEKTTTTKDEGVTPVEAPAEATEEKAAAAPTEQKPVGDVKKDDNRRPNRGGKGGRGRGKRVREPKEFEESIINIDRVTRVTKGGRQMRFRVSVVIGDKKGRVGFGIGKSSEVMVGVQKAVSVAKKNLMTVPIFEDSLPHEIIGKFKASTVLLFPAPEGKGIIAGGAVRKILELAGIKNVLSKMHGSRNRINTTYATINALAALQNRAPMKKEEDAEEKVEEKAEATETKKEAPKKKAVAKKKPAAKKPAAKKTTKKAADKK